MFSRWIACCWWSTDWQRGGPATGGERHHLDRAFATAKGVRIEEKLSTACESGIWLTFGDGSGLGMGEDRPL